jgi:hypothetical protein
MLIYFLSNGSKSRRNREKCCVRVCVCVCARARVRACVRARTRAFNFRTTSR